MSFAKSNTGQAIWLALGSLSTIGISLISVMILSRYFDKSTYGTYRQVLFIYTSLLVVFNAGLPKIFGYFLPKVNRSQGKKIVSKVTLILFTSGAVFSLVLFYGAEIFSKALHNPSLKDNLRWFSIVPFLLLPTLGVEGIHTSYKQSHFIAIYKTFSKLALLFCIIYPVILFGSEIKYAIYGWIIGSFLNLVLALYFKYIPFKGVEYEESWVSSKVILKYSLPIVAASLSAMAIRAADQFYISRYFGEEVFAEFSNGFTPLPFVAMISGSAGAVLMPLFSGYLENKENISKVSKIFKSTMIKSGLLIYPLVIFCFIHAEKAIVVLYSSEYNESTIYFKLFLFLHLFNIIIFSPLLFAAGETRFYAKLHIYSAIAIWILGYFVIIGFNNPIYIAVLSILMAITRVIIAIVKTSSVLNVSVFSLLPFKQLITMVIHCSFIMVIIKLLIDCLNCSNNLIYLAINGCIALAIILLTSGLFNLNYLLAIKPIINKLQSIAKS